MSNENENDDHQKKRLERLFWDIDLSVVNPLDYPTWMLERVLEYGDLDDVRLLIRLFGRDSFLNMVAASRYCSRKTRCFWDEILKQEGLSCTRKSSPATVWIC